jgi:hypothetical protein
MPRQIARLNAPVPCALRTFKDPATAIRMVKIADRRDDGESKILACDRAARTFDRDGWPDNWSVIQRVADSVFPGLRAY